MYLKISAIKTLGSLIHKAEKYTGYDYDACIFEDIEYGTRVTIANHMSIESRTVFIIHNNGCIDEIRGWLRNLGWNYNDLTRLSNIVW